MKKLIIILSIIVAPIVGKAQFYEAVNSLPNLISPALSGSGAYKGYVEAGYSHTLGRYNGDFIEISTSQGYQYNSWFFMGLGIGFDMLFSHKNTNWGQNMTTPPSNKESTTSVPMLPIFSDFRFLIGDKANISFFLDLKVGCSFLLSNRYVAIGDGYLTSREYFFLDPSIGIRIPVNRQKPKQAFNAGVKYKLITSNYWYQANNNITLQSLGLFIAFEW